VRVPVIPPVRKKRYLYVVLQLRATFACIRCAFCKPASCLRIADAHARARARARERARLLRSCQLSLLDDITCERNASSAEDLEGLCRPEKDLLGSYVAQRRSIRRLCRLERILGVLPSGNALLSSGARRGGEEARRRAVLRNNVFIVTMSVS